MVSIVLQSLKILMILKNCHSILCIKNWKISTIFTILKNLTTQKKELKNKVLNNAGDLYNSLYHSYKDKYNREINSLDTENRKRLDYKKLKIIDYYRYSSEEEQEKQLIITDVKAFNNWINDEETDINNKLFTNHFKIQRPSEMLKLLYQTNDREKNTKLVSMINSGLKDLKEEIKEMSGEERENEKPDKILKIVREILTFNKKTQKGKGIKILTPNQMLSRLPISLVQLKAGNN